MRFMRDSVRYPAFDEKEFANEREVVIGEIDRNESNPFSVVSKEMNERLFFKYPSRKNAARQPRDRAVRDDRHDAADSRAATTCRTTRR